MNDVTLCLHALLPSVRSVSQMMITGNSVEVTLPLVPILADRKRKKCQFTAALLSIIPKLNHIEMSEI